MQLKDLEAYLKFPGNFPVAKIEFSYLKLPVQTAVYVEKPLKLIKKEEKMNENEVLSNIVHLNFKEESPESNKGGEDEESPTLSEKNEHEIGEKEMRETSAEISELTI